MVGVSQRPDPAHVELHRMARPSVRVERLAGRAWHVQDGKFTGELEEGDALQTGQTVALEAEAELLAEGLCLVGGRKGNTHSLVSMTAFRASPNRGDVPKLLRQLAQIEREIEGSGNDPLAAAQSPPRTPHERASAIEFARANLNMAAARLLPESLARRLKAMVIFVSEETAFVAFESVDVAKLRTVMEALERPIHSHLVPAGILEPMLDQIYGRRSDAPS